MPMITPVHTNKLERILASSRLTGCPFTYPPTFLIDEPLRISPRPIKDTPSKATFLAPIKRISLAFKIAKAAMQATVRDPTNAKVDGEDKPCWKRAPWRTPQLYVVPTNQKAIIEQTETITQP